MIYVASMVGDGVIGIGGCRGLRGCGWCEMGGIRARRLEFMGKEGKNVRRDGEIETFLFLLPQIYCSRGAF